MPSHSFFLKHLDSGDIHGISSLFLIIMLLKGFY